ncbi:MAG: hypothetical protein IJR63_06270 [Synergistaceae bacterium]|nr:hypothetical protein [Synergistaceae bacterium]
MRVTILTNGPGELWGWVRPVCSELRRRGHSISLWLLPCPFSSGLEREAASLLGVDKLEGPSSFSVTWREIAREHTDTIIQLGGDVSFGARMADCSHVPLTVYSYRHSRVIRGAKLLTAYREQATFTQQQVTPIGDLVKDAVKLDITPSAVNSWDWYRDDDSPRILFLPGSRPKIRSAVISWLCELRDSITRLIPNARIRSLFPQFMPEQEMSLWRKEGLNPVKAGAGAAMREADYAITQPGTNNFEMMHSGLPGLVVVPEKFLAYIPVSGVASFFTGLPLLGGIIRRKALMHTVSKWNGYISLPNRTFQRDILTELWGNITPVTIAEKVRAEIADRDKLSALRKELLGLSGTGGAASRLVDIAAGSEEL